MQPAPKFTAAEKRHLLKRASMLAGFSFILCSIVMIGNMPNSRPVSSFLIIPGLFALVGALFGWFGSIPKEKQGDPGE